MKITAQEGDTWQSIAERTTGPGTHPAIIEANGGHPEHQPAAGSDVEVPGYEESTPDAEEPQQPAQTADEDADESDEDEEESD